LSYESNFQTETGQSVSHRPGLETEKVKEEIAEEQKSEK